MRTAPRRAAVVAAAASLGVLGTALALPAAAMPAPPTPTPTAPGPHQTTSTPTSAYLPGTTCRAFPADNVWHADVSTLPVNARSAQWLSHMSTSRNLHPDFGPSFGAQPAPYGIPITIVRGATRVPVAFGYPSESDRVRYPLSTATKLEGGMKATSTTGGDRHAIVVDAATCQLFETWDTHLRSSGWYAGSGAVWSLTSDALRPAGWTSADAAGLPILPGLLRYDEVAAGRVDHAIRFTTDVTNRAFVWPARHQAGSVSDATYPPMGARFRLKASFDISRFPASAQVVLKAMKTYGLVLADNGSPWYFQGTADTRWTSAFIDSLRSIPASAFEAVDSSALVISSSSGAARRL